MTAPSLAYLQKTLLYREGARVTPHYKPIHEKISECATRVWELRLVYRPGQNCIRYEEDVLRQHLNKTTPLGKKN